VKSIGSGRRDGAGPAPPTRSLREERLLRSVEHGSTPKSLPRATARPTPAEGRDPDGDPPRQSSRAIDNSVPSSTNARFGACGR
jgi:hypothetical protein